MTSFRAFFFTVVGIVVARLTMKDYHKQSVSSLWTFHPTAHSATKLAAA